MSLFDLCSQKLFIIFSHKTIHFSFEYSLLSFRYNNEKINKHLGLKEVDESFGLNISSVVDLICEVLSHIGSTVLLSVGIELLFDRLVLLLTVLDDVIVGLLCLLNDFDKLLEAVTLRVLEVVPLELGDVVLVRSLTLFIVNKEEAL